LLLRSTRSDQITNDHQPRCDADARLERRVGLQIAYSSDQLHPCAHGLLGVVFVFLAFKSARRFLALFASG
jgi:hypothetical protein